MLSLPIWVVDPDGKPVAGAVVVPWALRCSQGHGPWHVGGFGDSDPPTLTTGANGRADVPYPRYALASERVHTTGVTLSIDHKDFVYVGDEHVDVPIEEPNPHLVTLERGARVEIIPMENGQPAPPEGLYAMCSDGRVWTPGVWPTITADGALRLPALPASKGQVIVVRLDGERATHFSRITDLELNEGETLRERFELRPAVRITGKFSENVPRPVSHGRLKLQTLPKERAPSNLNWFTWAPVAADGTFTIEAWPAGEAAQLTALCDGYIAESGAAPAGVEARPVPAGFLRPQVFSSADQARPVAVRMVPTTQVAVETVDQHGRPIAGVKVGAYPNVAWWNGGAQVYCSPLARAERALVQRDWWACIDEPYAPPFSTTTDASGHGELELPAGRHRVYAKHSDYELPIVRGRRERRVVLAAGEPATVRLVLVPKGTDYLGECDKLAGALFGCTGEQCRRLIDDPGFRDKMNKVRIEYDAAEDPTDPKVLRHVYSELGQAFDGLGDDQEAAKWRRKAAEQAAKLAPAKNAPVKP